jgi:thioredoxin 1
MASADTLAFTTANFQSEVLASQEPVLVDFWAEWCGPCRAIAPTIDQLATQFKGRVKIGKLDIDAERDVAMNFGIQSIPTLLFFKGGKVVDKLVGVPNKAALTAKIEAIAG